MHSRTHTRVSGHLTGNILNLPDMRNHISVMVNYINRRCKSRMQRCVVLLTDFGCGLRRYNSPHLLLLSQRTAKSLACQSTVTHSRKVYLFYCSFYTTLSLYSICISYTFDYYYYCQSQELLANAGKCCLNECLRACCCLPPLSQTALSNHRRNTKKNTQKYEPWVINMVKSGNYHYENKMFILSVKYGTIPHFIERVASLTLNIAVTLHNVRT